jgi:hypothetical protein
MAAASPYTEGVEPVEPPEIREPKEKYRIVEFYVDLGAPRPDLQVIGLVDEWLRENPPLPMACIQFNYQPETDDQPALLIANLYVGEPIDIG